MLKGFKCVTGTPQGKAQASLRICSCFSFFSRLIGPIRFSILSLTLQSARQITGILREPLVSFWFPNSYPLENISGQILLKTHFIKLEEHNQSKDLFIIFLALIFHFSILSCNVHIFSMFSSYISSKSPSCSSASTTWRLNCGLS